MVVVRNLLMGCVDGRSLGRPNEGLMRGRVEEMTDQSDGDKAIYIA